MNGGPVHLAGCDPATVENTSDASNYLDANSPLFQA